MAAGKKEEEKRARDKFKEKLFLLLLLLIPELAIEPRGGGSCHKVIPGDNCSMYLGFEKKHLL